MPHPVLISIGGHVAGALVQQLGAVPGLADKVEFHLSPTLPSGRAVAAPDVLARACVVLDEDGAITAQERAFLPESCAVITLPRLDFPILWPAMGNHPAHGDDGRFVPANSLHDLAQAHHRIADEMFRREARCDIRVAGFVLSGFRAERLFHARAHPAGPLLVQIMAQLLGHPAMRALAGDFDTALQAVLPGLDAVFHDAQTPVHAAVAAHFALEWWSAPLACRQDAVMPDRNAWADWHRRMTIPRPAPLLPAPQGIALAASATPVPPPLGPTLAQLHATTVHAAAEMVRVAPFFATAIDPVVARHGAALLSAASARYLAAPCLMVRLDRAVVLGHCGAVLHDGTLVADTLVADDLPFAATPMPMPAADGPRIATPSFLGFASGWAQDPHGITTLLPRLIAYARLRRYEPELRLLLPEPLATAPWLRDMLALLGIGSAITWLDNVAVACTGLVVTTGLHAELIPPAAHLAAQALAALVPLVPPGPKLLYLRSHDTTGRLANAPGVAATLEARGFTLVDADSVPLARRIALLRHATAVVAAQGPALAELAYCPPGAAVLELVGPANPSAQFWSLASCAALRYGYLVGNAVGAPEWGGDYDVSLPMLDHAAALMSAA